ncbi:MAG: hypothetical protein A2286_10395 [Gammaproteobacteria bacterium RIFOXYA12_FULL_61_12]|nr:MAG: hypothetical protein A2514_08520 [Gammaproteobacteria bacterium RIFOXYD12_FULL_61_37]OGT94644.1 MAG: hypothetical protein A2286_10395 [Gammaproteobacteria bacterium RIFOXYA12_FULL_61_12]
MSQLRYFCISLLLLFGASQAFAQPITLVTLGDSLTKGDGDAEGGGGYPARLQKKLEAAYPSTRLMNLAQSGMTTDDLIDAQLEPALEQLGKAPPGNAKVALVWIGSNDLFGLYNFVCDEQYPNDYESCERESSAIFSDNINTILASLQSGGASVYIALLDDQSKRPVMTDQLLRQSSFDRFTAEEVPRMAAQIAKYNDIIRKTAARLGVTLVDFSTTTLLQNRATLDRDGNHPNGAGYDQIADIWHQAVASATPNTPAPTTPPAIRDPVPDADVDPEDAPGKANDAATDITPEPSLEPVPPEGAKGPASHPPAQ